MAMILVFGIWLVNLESFLQIPPPLTSASLEAAIPNR